MDRRRTKKKRQKRKALIPEFENTETLEKLETLASNLGVEIRSEKGDFQSGYCRVNDQNLIILKKDDSIEKKIDLIAVKLADYETDNIEIHPAIQQFIEQKKSEILSLNGTEEE